MRQYGKKFWRSVPFIRLLIPLSAGILLARYIDILPAVIFITALIASVIIFLSRFFAPATKYKTRWVTGLMFNFLMLCAGTALMYFQNIEHNPRWIGKHIHGKEWVLVTLQEPLTEKTNSFKALASVDAVLEKSRWIPVKGNILLYFKKDTGHPALQYGSQLIIQKPLQPITNSGNPGGFDYKQYCASQDIHYQVYLQPKEYRVSYLLHTNIFTNALINTRSNVLSILRKFIPGEKETGVAEALLIGYRDDLDKDLVRSYSNTGVVHIIAISGLHLGMIYGLLILLLKPFRKVKWIRWAKPVIILAVLWGFSFLAGAVPSILRSAVMFSFIVIGESLGRKTNIYNTLAASAFCLLVYNPYFFWDVGFQLSYTAVLSIVLFMKPIYRQLYFRNKLLHTIWELNAVTLSAQILTLPVILFYFHQFPNLFLFTNFIAVPVSGFILYGELLLLILFKIPVLNMYTGKVISFLISQMNGVIERTDRLPFSITENIQVSLWQSILLYITIAYLAWWLMQKKSNRLLMALSSLAVYVCLGSIRTIQQKKQHKLVVYNIPKHTAIDIMEGTAYRFIGDSVLLEKNFLQNFHLQPSRVLHGVKMAGILPNTVISSNLVITGHSSVLLIDNSFVLHPSGARIPVDIIIIRGNPRIYLTQLAAVFNCQQYIFDSSNPLWKIRYWKKDADNLHLRHHSIPEQGAFEMAL